MLFNILYLQKKNRSVIVCAMNFKVTPLDLKGVVTGRTKQANYKLNLPDMIKKLTQSRKPIYEM